MNLNNVYVGAWLKFHPGPETSQPALACLHMDSDLPHLLGKLFLK